MKKTAACVLLFSTLTIGWAKPAYAVNFGDTTMGMGQFLALIALHCIFLFISSKILDFEGPDFWRAVSSSLGIAAIFFLMLVFTADSDSQNIGLVVVAIVAVVIIQRVYNTTPAKTLGAFLITAIAMAIAMTALSGAF